MSTRCEKFYYQSFKGLHENNWQDYWSVNFKANYHWGGFKTGIIAMS